MPFLGSLAVGVSANGDVVTGQTNLAVPGGPLHGFRWEQGQMQDIGQLSGYPETQPYAISADGAVIVGVASDGGTSSRAFRWSTSSGMLDLGHLGELDRFVTATGASGDGSVVVGYSGATPFRWTAVTGMQPLPMPPGTVLGYVAAVSSDGSVAVGSIQRSSYFSAAYWDCAGFHDLATLLGSSLPPDWMLMRILDVAADNRTFVGWGNDAWIATLPPAGCYANCDASTLAPVLNINDFVCFQTRFTTGDASANCDQSTAPPVLNVSDFICFQQRFAAGCQ